MIPIQGEWIMRVKTIVVYLFISIILVSCYSSPEPENVNNLIDYSDVASSEKSHHIGISLYNRNLLLLKQSVMNEITHVGGRIRNETIENTNECKIKTDIPKSTTEEFMEKIKQYGITVQESKTAYEDRHLERTKENIEELYQMIEIKNKLLNTDISLYDKLALEKDILQAKMDIKYREEGIKELEARIGFSSVEIRMYNQTS